jgi:hypothetical protein
LLSKVLVILSERSEAKDLRLFFNEPPPATQVRFSALGLGGLDLWSKKAGA